MNGWIIAGGLALAGAGALLASGKGRLREDLDWETAPRPGSLIDIDGYRVHVVEAGAGPAMVMVHGFGGQTYSYRSLIPLFATDYRVIAVDLKGFGYSERSVTAGMSGTDQVAMLHGLLERLGVERAVFIGHSMGGGVVQRLAATYPQMVEAAILAASVDTERTRRMRTVAPAWMMRPLMPYLGRMATSRLLRLSYSDPSVLTDDVRDEYRRPGRMRGSMEGLLQMMQDYRRDEPIAFERITMPVLLLNGADDRIVPIEFARGIQARIPQAKLRVISHAGHMLLEERPDACAEAIRGFLARSAARAQAAATTA